MIPNRTPALTLCEHLESITDPIPETQGCEDCLAAGKHDWVHLRTCQTCGHVGCCDQSPSKHASAHFNVTGHPVVRSYEPGEDWYWCYVEQVGFELADHPEAPSHQ